MLTTYHISGSPCLDILAAIILLIAGILLFIYRNPIGDFTGYYTGRGGTVDRPTPGCLLIPFAVAAVAGGLVILIRSIQTLLAGQ